MDLSVQMKSQTGKIEGLSGFCQEVPVSAGQLYNIKAGKSPVRIQSLEGVLWVTRENDPVDYMLTCCQAAVFADGGKIVIQSLSKGKIRIQSNL